MNEVIQTLNCEQRCSLDNKTVDNLIHSLEQNFGEMLENHKKQVFSMMENIGKRQEMQDKVNEQLLQLSIKNAELRKENEILRAKKIRN